MIKIAITGMTCGHCTKAVARALAKVPGVEGEPKVELNPGGAMVEGTADTALLLAAVVAEGYEARLA